ncbi:oxygenase MpaB family protein [Aspergillus lucknowensis]|uniref:ER-bound oxygenase mpaB/mpaB'/Rubber oxygenase catalytic domain-containing protein n=1 Tax=Aspergillus lucknowensis TaxID=176173 RepID=A0ABR4M088_9EURO
MIQQNIPEKAISSSSHSEGSSFFTITIEKDDSPFFAVSPLAMEDLKVAHEGIALAGGAAAILLQAAHPLVGQGIADHSTFTKPHARMKSEGGPRAYLGLNPKLQLWVALIYGPLSLAMAERVCQAYLVMAISMQVPREMWPKDLRAFRVYWRDMIENKLRVTADAGLVLGGVFHPSKSVPLWMRPAVVVAMPFIRRLTIEQLPSAVCEQFHLRSTKSSRVIGGLFVSGMTCVYPFTPLFIRQLPKTNGQLVKP